MTSHRIHNLSCGYSHHLEAFEVVTDPLDYYLFRLQTEGESTVCVNGETAKLSAGDLVLCGRGDRYELYIDAPSSGNNGSGDYYIMCYGEWLDQWWKREARPSIVPIGLHERLLGMWQHLLLEKRRIGERQSELGEYLAQALCLYIDDAIKESARQRPHGLAIYRMRRYIEEQAAQPLRVEEIAREVGFSASRAAHLFRETFGESVMQYAIKVRLNMAVDRIKYSTLTLEQIAISCGFGSYPNFYKAFKRSFDMSPNAYREAWTQGHPVS